MRSKVLGKTRFVSWRKIVQTLCVSMFAAASVSAEEVDYSTWKQCTNTSSSVNCLSGTGAVDQWNPPGIPAKGEQCYIPAGCVAATSSGKAYVEFKGAVLAVHGALRARMVADYRIAVSNLWALDGGEFHLVTPMDVRGSMYVKSTPENPFTIGSYVAPNSIRAVQEFDMSVSGDTSAALVIERREESKAALPDYALNLVADWSDYLGTLKVSERVELQIGEAETAPTSFPSRVTFDDKTFLTFARTKGDVVFNEVAVDGELTLSYSCDNRGQSAVMVVTNALTLSEGGKIVVKFAKWRPRTGVQKYPILRLSGAAAASSLTAAEFDLTALSKPLWYTLPKTTNPRIVIEDEGADRVFSVVWPDEPEPFAYVNADGALVIRGSDTYENFLDNITDDESVPLAVVKEGEGTAQLGPDCSFTGGIDVKGGKLIVGNPSWKYFRWVVRDTFRGEGVDGGSKYRVVGIRSFGLFDAAGNDRVYKLSDEGDCTTYETSSYTNYMSYKYPNVPIEEGHFRVGNPYSSKGWVYVGLLEAKTNIPTVTNLFAHSSWAAPNFWNRPHSVNPRSSDDESWIAFTMRPRTGAPITHWDYVNAYYQYDFQSISNSILEASLDCENWTEVGRVLNSAIPARNTWQGTGEAYEPGFETHTGGMPLDSSWPTNAIAFVPTKVSVASGATLEAYTSVAPLISNWEIDLSKGAGTISGFEFASTGVLRVRGTGGSRSFVVAAGLANMKGLANLSNWQVYLEDAVKPTKVRVIATNEGVTIRVPGTVFILR